MLQLRSVLVPADNSGAKALRLIHVHGAWKRKSAHLGDIITAVVNQADPNGIVKDSEMVKAVIVRTRKEYRRKDGSYIRFDDNACVIIDQNSGDPKATRIFGPVAREVKDKGFSKIASLATEVL
jgi:ribosomal protein L14, bacterial/organelle